VVLPDRKYAKLWSGMKPEEYADEAPLLKVVIARLYDQEKSVASSHHNINKLRVKLATGRDASLVRLPLCHFQRRKR
jgi:hypothetical protein